MVGFLEEALDGGLGLADHRHDDLAVGRRVLRANHDVIAVVNAGLDHRVTGDVEEELAVVAAGSPVLAEENIDEYVQVPELAGGGDGEFVLAIKGDSMINAGIHDKDHVVVRSQETARNGEIVVALVGEAEATVKRFFKESDHVRLQPENDSLEPIRSTEVKVLGKVVGVLRRVA